METFEEWVKTTQIEPHTYSYASARRAWITQQKTIEQKDKEIVELKKTVEFYANPDNYDTCWGDKSRIVTKDMEKNPFEERLRFPFDCGGKLARKVLKKYNN